MKANFSEAEEQEMYETLKEQYVFLGEARSDITVKSLLNRLERRYLEAKNNKVNMVIFFEAEALALEQFKEKMESESLGQRDSSAIDNIFEKMSESIKKYARTPIHKNASEEIERLLGALIGFRKSFMNSFLSLKRLSKSIEHNNNFIDFMNLLEDLTYSKRDNELPMAFNSFRFALEVHENSPQEIERCQVDMFKKSIFLFKKAKQFGVFLEQLAYKSEIIKIKKIPFMDEDLFLDQFSGVLAREANQILNDFRLDDFY